MKPSKEYISCIGNCKVYGDKILIHISVLKRAIKRLKRNPDIYDREHFREGQADVILDMISTINRGMRTIRENNEKKK